MAFRLTKKAMSDLKAKIDFRNIAIVGVLLFLWEWLGPNFYFAYAMRHSLQDHRAQYVLLFFLTIIGFAFNIYFICKFAFLLVTRKRRWVTLAAGAAWCILMAINLAFLMSSEASRAPNQSWQQAKFYEYLYQFMSIALGFGFNYLLGSIHFPVPVRRPSHIE